MNTFTIPTKRLRTISTGIMHSPVNDVYTDLYHITGQLLLTHMLGNAAKACVPWLRKHLGPEFFDGQHRPDVEDVMVVLPFPTGEERKAMFEVYVSLRSPLEKRANTVAEA